VRIRGLSRNVIALGWVSFFTDLASEMLYPVIPLFLTGTLGASTELLGLIEGVAEGGSSILRWVAGAFSDRFRRRKPFVVAGYAVSALSKPVMGLAAYVGGWPLFFAGRTSDRIGKSIRTSARDALIADSTEPQHRGLAFGFHRAMDTCGAIVGPLSALLILWLRPGFPLQWLFFIALAPGIASAALAWAAVRDVPHEPQRDAERLSLWQSYPGRFWLLIVAAGVFSLGNSSDQFLILRSRDLGMSFTTVILAYAIYNGVYALAATPLGRLSDRIGRKPVIVAGWLVYAGVYLGFAAARSAALPWMLLSIYGLYQALTEGVTKALISDVIASPQRGGAIGMFYTITGACQLAANLVTGALWHVWLADHRLLAGLLPGVIGPLIAIPILLAVRPGAASSRR
jgi:MFS family permease